ncbi:uncharacterized protein LTR77_001202 [Saxophila tyrrhenica]|uniref:BZIP domain-containing protein n=1 Tax=Saxophila tyrrhenica TaxID=1690608 RepID=A0AAV9PLF2_9PEZI|nr:hypothetical protein LTR77_001202 [Saxophila tyrrhenica]
MQTNTQHEANSAGSGYGSNSGGERSPLSFLKNITSEKKQTKDGQPAKRRGPKPDSKPAMTRRQELNRQAQRTHRERKEQYIKTLEAEVLRLKDVYADSTRDRDKVMEENRRLRILLEQHGISYNFGESPVKFQRENSGYGPSSSGSISGSYPPGSDSTGFSPPPSSGQPMQISQQHPGGMQQQQRPMASMAQLPNNQVDYDQIGIDFVLTYDSQGRPTGRAPAPPPPR